MSILRSHSITEEFPNGRYQTEFNIRLIAFDRGNGVRRCTNIARTNQGGGTPIQLREAFDFDLADRLAGNAPVLRFGKGRSRVAITPLDTNNSPVSHPSDTTWLFNNAWNGADYRLISANHKLDKAILLRAGHPARFQFRIDENAGLNLDTLSTPDFRILQPVLENPGSIETIPLRWDVSVQGGKAILTCVLPPGNWAGWVVDPTLTLQPDATDGLDTILYSWWSTYNYGIANHFGIGEGTWNIGTIERALLKFDLSSLPDTAIISATTLSLWLVAAGSSYASSNNSFAVYRVKRAWLEGTRSDAEDNPATGATWIRYDTSNNWTTAGCGDTTNDREAASIGTSDTWLTTDAVGTQRDTSITGSTKANLDLGNGWILVGTTELDDLFDFCSSDHATASQRPKLVVVYQEAISGQRVFTSAFVPAFRGPFG